MAGRLYEDFRIGERYESRAVTLAEEDVVAFAMDYDPQPFHIDPEAARSSIYGGLIASGIQTFALTFRLFLDTGAITEASEGGTRVDDLCWHRPVRPGDTLRVVSEVVEKDPRGPLPELGFVRIRHTAYNQRGKPALSMVCHHLLRRREADPGKTTP